MRHSEAPKASWQLFEEERETWKIRYTVCFRRQSINTETTVCASYYRCRDGQILEDGTYPIGRPVLGAEIRILDAEGNEVKKGEIGEICIYGNGVSRGYIGDHDEENKAFEKLPDGGVMYRSGYLMNIYTIPEVRSEGIGRKIIEYLINDAKERGTEKIFLESSGVAKKLYHEIGFADMEDYMKLEDQQYADQRN